MWTQAPSIQRREAERAIEPTAFRDFFHALAPEVRGWAARVVGPDTADDVVAETFTVVWQRWEHLPTDPDHRRAWVFVVARHKMAHVRSRWTRDGALQRRLTVAATSPNVRDVGDVVATSSSAAQILRELSPEDREVLVLVGVDGMSPADAAAVLGCTMTAMTTRLSRARRRLAAAMVVAELVDPTGRMP